MAPFLTNSSLRTWRAMVRRPFWGVILERHKAPQRAVTCRAVGEDSGLLPAGWPRGRERRGSLTSSNTFWLGYILNGATFSPRLHFTRRDTLACQFHGVRSRILRSGDSGARTARKSVRPKSVTYVLGTLCHPCVRAGPVERGAPGESRTPDPPVRS
jgi:hypothetical protein